MIKKIIMLISVILLTSCAATQTIKEEKPISLNPNGLSTIYVAITATNSVEADSHYASVTLDLNSKLTDLINQGNKFRVIGDKSSANYILKLHVTEFQYVDEFSRVMMGILAGHAVLVADIELVDSKNSNVVWQASVDSTSDHMQGIFGNSTGAQVDGLASYVAKKINN